MKPWIELHIKTNKAFRNRVVFNVADGKHNRVEFTDGTLILTLLIRKYKYKLIDKFEFQSFPQKMAKKGT